MTQYLPSTKPQRVVSLSESKNAYGQHCLVAIEGELQDVGGGNYSFTYAPFGPNGGDRSHRITIGRKSKKNRELAYNLMSSDLTDMNMIPSGTMINIP